MFSRVFRNFTKSYVHQALLACLVGLALFSTTHALAAQVGSVVEDPSPIVSSSIVAWASVTALLCTALMGLTSPGTKTPWNWTPTSRFWFATVVTVASGACHSITTGVSLQTAGLTAASALLMAVIAHFSTPGSMQKKEDVK